MKHNYLREQIISTVRRFAPEGLGVGTSGNLSTRTDHGFLITPTGVAYEQLLPADIVELNDDGQIISGTLKPSSEWRFHCDIYRCREEVNAIVHVHSPYATALACTRQDIPAFHYMVARAGGDSIRCADYATFGTQALSENVVKALVDRHACLLANHGMIAVGKNIASAFALTQEVEELARQYILSKQAGSPVLLDEEEMRINLEKFKTYGSNV